MFNNIRARQLLAILIFFISTSSGAVYSAETGTRVGNLAPDFTVTNLQGKTFSLAEYKNVKPVYLIFWATWCKVCKQEIPHFKKLYEEYGDNIEILAINVDSLSWWSSLSESNSRVNAYVKENTLTYPVTLDDKEELMTLYKVQGTPTQLLIDKNGVILLRTHLYSEKVASLIKSL